MPKQNAVDAYRKAAIALWGANETEAANYIMSPEDDRGEWAPNADVIIYLEPDGRFPEDKFVIPDKLSYWSRMGFDNCIVLSEKAGKGHIEYINAAVAAVYDY